MFSNSNVAIQGGTFITVQGDVNYYIGEREIGLQALSKEIAHGAIHDSSERYPPPRCHPRTRERVLKILEDWICNPNKNNTNVLWLSGVVGVGKSAIMQELATKLSGGHVSADFFFAKGQQKRGDARYLFPTIAYQLAMNVPALRGPIDDAMSADLTLPKKTLEVQLRALVLNPLSTVDRDSLPVSTVIIDGLDECEGHHNQAAILQLIGITVSQYNLPIRFLIASRPEAHIHEIFRSPKFEERTRHIILDDSFHPEEDIKVYLLEGFADIYKRKSDLFSADDLPWPTEEVLESLLERMSGQFIFAATVLKFVDSRFTHPKTQLELLYEYRETEGLSEIDRLYTQILSTHPNRELLIRVLGVVVASMGNPTLSMIDDFLQLENGTSRVTLQGLVSLLRGTGIDHEHPSVLHASFEEFLLDESRSGCFFIDAQMVRKQLLWAYFSDIAYPILFTFISLFISFWFGVENTIYRYGDSKLRPETWNWLSSTLIAHCSAVAPFTTFFLFFGGILVICLVVIKQCWYIFWHDILGPVFDICLVIFEVW